MEALEGLSGLSPFPTRERTAFMPLPVAHALIGASIVAVSRKDISLRKDGVAMLAGASIAVVPDLDLILSWTLGYGLQTHAGATHSILFAVLLGSLAAWLRRETRFRGVFTYTMASLSHGLLDVAAKRDFGGAALLWPFSSVKYRLGLAEYFEFYPHPLAQPIGPILERALEICNYEMLIFMPVFILCVWWRRWQDQTRVSVPAPKVALASSR
jgi:inner membrane protein